MAETLFGGRQALRLWETESKLSPVGAITTGPFGELY